MGRHARVVGLCFFGAALTAFAGQDAKPIALVLSCSGDARVKTLRDGTVFARDHKEILKGETVVTGSDGLVELSLSNGKPAKLKGNDSWPKRDFFEPVKKGWDVFVASFRRQLQLNKVVKAGGGKGSVMPQGSWTSVATEAVLGSDKSLDVLVVVRGSTPLGVKAVGDSSLVTSALVAKSSDGTYLLMHYRLRTTGTEVGLSADKKTQLKWKVRDGRMPDLAATDSFLAGSVGAESQVYSYLAAGRLVSAVLSVGPATAKADVHGKEELAKALYRVASRNGDLDIPALIPAAGQ